MFLCSCVYAFNQSTCPNRNLMPTLNDQQLVLWLVTYGAESKSRAAVRTVSTLGIAIALGALGARSNKFLTYVVCLLSNSLGS